MKYASSGYTRIMKTVTVWVMALFLFAPITTIVTPKTNSVGGGVEIVPSTAQAANCVVLNATFAPSTTGWKGDEFQKTFYQGRNKDGSVKAESVQKHVQVKVLTQNCIGQELILQITGKINSRSIIIENYDGTDFTTYSSRGTDMKFKPASDVGNGINVFVVEFYPGEDACSGTGNSNNDCIYKLKIYKTKVAPENLLQDTASPNRDNQRGQISYDCNEDWKDSSKSCSVTAATDAPHWRLLSHREGDLTEAKEADFLWYYKKGDSFIVAGDARGSDGLSVCEQTATTASADKGSCTFQPDATKISDQDSVIDQGKSIGTTELPPCGFTNWTIVGCVGVFLRSVVWSAVAWFAGLVGQLFDLVFMYSISADPYKNPFIEYAWTFVRDICNASFIFILLYIAIMTVLNNTKKVDYKQIIPKIILVALIVNFSLFFGRVIIDVGNVSARLLYRSDVVSIKKADGSYGSISGALIDSFDPQNLIINGAKNFNQVTGLNGGGVDSVGFIVITIMSILMLFMFMKVLLEITFIFIGRIVGLWMQLILAPIAFVSEALPFKVGNIMGTGSDSKESWFSATLNQSIQATVFTFFLYLTLLFASMGVVALENINGLTSGVGFFLAMILPYLVIMALLKTAKDKTASMATAIAKQATSVLQSAVGTVSGIALGAAGVAGVAVLGRAGAAMSKSEWAQNLMSKKGSGSGLLGPGDNLFKRFGNKQINNLGAKLGSGVISTGEKMSKGSFDARAGGALAGLLKQGGIDINANSKLQKMAGGITGINTKTGGFVQSEKDKEEKLQKEFDALASRKTDKEYQQEYDLKAQRARIIEESKYMQKMKDEAKKNNIDFDEKQAREDWEKTEKKKWQDKYEIDNPKPAKDEAQKRTQQRQATYVQTMRDNQIRQNQDRVVGGLVGTTTGLLTGNLVGAYSAAAGAVAGGVAGVASNNGVEAKFLLKYEKDREDAIKKVKPALVRDLQNVEAEIKKNEKEIDKLNESMARKLKDAVDQPETGSAIKEALNKALEKEKTLTEATSDFAKYFTGKGVDTKNADAVLNYLKTESEGTDEVKAKEALKQLKTFYLSAQPNIVGGMDKNYDKLDDLKEKMEDMKRDMEDTEARYSKTSPEYDTAKKAHNDAKKKHYAFEKEIKRYEKANSVYTSQDEKSRKNESNKERKKKIEESLKETNTKFSL